ncbi:MAG: hypothetical protein HN855_08140 [Anaerolineae bacterium]|nr:hypothetical protein [Anaerolineae bacterium]MBT7069485.1 hypothetical protein [Anaerolineae bacterium]MBT7325112.1 hypothetical protein [Anaerolineae bacterium]
MSKLTKSPLFWFISSILAIVVMTFFGPEEATLGANVRLVYLHGAWVLTAELLFALAALIGLIALISRKEAFYRWTTALGRSGIFYWISYLPLSMWAMQANWNGLFLAEPRFRLAMTFAIVGLLLQLGLWMLNINWLTAFSNIAFIAALRFIFATAENIMHPPPSPIFNSGNWAIIGFFVGLNLLTWLSAYFVTRFFLPKG